MDFTIDPSVPAITGDFTQGGSENTQENTAGNENPTATATGNEHTEEGPTEATGDEVADVMDTSGGDAKFEEEAIIHKRPKFVDYLQSPIVTLLVGSGENLSSVTAHQMFLLRSPYFQRLFADPFLETVELPDDTIDAVGCFLQWLYTGEYFPRIIKSPEGVEYLEREENIEPTTELSSAPPPIVDENGDDLLKHARVYILAEKFEVMGLKHLAHAKIHRVTASAKGELAYARFVYANTSRDDKTIRNPIASFWSHRSHVLRHEAEDEFRAMVLDFPEFAYDILSMVLDQKEKGSSKDKGGDKDKDDQIQSSGIERTKSGRKRPRMSTLA